MIDFIPLKPLEKNFKPINSKKVKDINVPQNLIL